MSGYSWAPLAWTVLLVVSWPYVQRVRHAAMAPLAAYSIFVTTFSALAAVLFGMMTTLLAGFGHGAMLDRPMGVLLFLIVGFVPGILMGHWLIQRPLRRMPLPGE
jgi:hypothetical protein